MSDDRTRRGVVVDLDGTLVDTNYLHVVAWWRAFGDRGIRVPMRDVHEAIGLAGPDLVAWLYPTMAGEDIDAIVAAHGRHTNAWLDEVAPVRGAGDLLHGLRDRGLTVVVATSAEPERTDRLLNSTGGSQAVTEVVSSADAERGKPAPEPIELAVRRAGLHPEHTVTIGDSVWDMRSARRAGLPAVGLSCGGITRATLAEAGADAVYDDCADLLARIDDSPIAALY